MANAFRSAALVFASVSFLTSPANAGEATNEVSVAFIYDTETSAEENYRKLRKQVRRVCGSGGHVVSSAFSRNARRECSEALLTKAVAASQRAELIALHGTPASTSLAAATIR